LAVFGCKQLAVRRRVGEGDLIGAQVAAVHEGAPERESRAIGIPLLNQLLSPQLSPAGSSYLFWSFAFKPEKAVVRCQFVLDSGVTGNQEAV